MLLSYANVQFYQEMMQQAREAIAQGTYRNFVEDMRLRYARSADTGED
jgi:queuine/archaeosine tRNA-ribosyltransferase